MRLAIPALIVGAALAAPVFGKLPAPSDEAKAKAAEAAAKSAWANKVGAYQLCRAMDRTAEHYRKAAGKDAPAPIATPACTDPGPFVATPPLEAAAAHSPAATAAAQRGQPKK